jgi:hypothetical protein
MSEATELLEKMEEAAGHGHGHGAGHGPGKMIGITMAVLGVMLAFCAAMVGSERTELIKATVEQSNKWGVYQAEATKYRVMEADYEMLHALTPNKSEVKKFEDRLSSVRRAGGKSDDEDTAELKDAIHVATTELADVLTPDPEDEERISGLGKKYKHDMAEAKEDAEAFDLAIEAHHEASEWYERAQLCAEIGIVIASIALLLASRAVWAISAIIGLAGGGIVGWTFVHTRAAVVAAEKKIEEATKRTAEIEKDDDDDKAEGEGKAKDEKPGAKAEDKAKDDKASAKPDDKVKDDKAGAKTDDKAKDEKPKATDKGHH